MMILLLKEFWSMTTTLGQGGYPEFVLKNTALTHIPMFIYHRVDPIELERQLAYRQRNGYHTLTADEFYNTFQKNTSDEKAVVLTFDDGLDNLYQVAYPLLCKYSFKAVAFLIPNWIGKKRMITWTQAQEMNSTGVIDFQSHSLNHSAIFTSPKIIDFYNPNQTRLPLWTLPLVQTDAVGSWIENANWGAAIYTYTSRLSDNKRYHPDVAIQKYLVSQVAENGGKDFFKKKNWHQQLQHFVVEYKQQHPLHDKYESDDEQGTAIQEELLFSKQLIEKNLPGKRVQYFSYPWNQSGQLAEIQLNECGYVTDFGGLQTKQTANNESSKYYYINRVSGDFIKRLSGKGRKLFATILLSKMLRRVNKGTMY